MRYRTLLLEFLAQYREYQFDYFQLVLFNYLDRDSIIKVIDDKEKVALYQVSGVSVFQKMAPFNVLDHSVVEEIIASSKKIEKEVATLDGYQDVFNGLPVIKRKSRYLLGYPIIVNDEIIGCFIIYSPYPVSWQMEQSKVQNLIHNLTIAKCEELDTEASNLCGSNVFSFTKNNKTYLSESLSRHTKLSKVVDEFKPNGFNLVKLKQLDFEGGVLTGYDIIRTQPVLSIKTINEPLYKDYNLIFLYGEALPIATVNKAIKNSDGAIGRYQLYDCGEDTYLVSTKEALKTKLVDDLFKNIDHLVVRYGHELNRAIDVHSLVSYLKANHSFDKDAFGHYEKEQLATDALQIRDNYQPNKIKIRVIATSMEAGLAGYVIEDTTDLSKLALNGKRKSLNALIKTVLEYKKSFIYLKLSVDSLFINGKLNQTLLKVLTDALNEISSLMLVVDMKVADTLIKKDEALAKHLVVITGSEVIDSIAIASKVSGLYLENQEVVKLSINEATMNSFLQYLVSITSFVLIEIDANDITKYHLEHLMLVGI